MPPCELAHGLGTNEYPHQHRSRSPVDQARFAYAIVTAYAVLEQLGMHLYGEVFHNKRWIPAARLKFEQRLKEKGVNVMEPLLWNLRGGKTTLELERPPTILRKATWSFGNIRDSEVDVVDAVADVRWLRSKVSAHKMSELAALLSAYDVANAQRLAWRFLLDRLGLRALDRF
jgi:hypothetical protein